jgi:2-methylisocitrate lyase-like PEP mutase family enzyme
MDLLTFPEMRETVDTIIAAAPNVLWLADGDTGYGNAISVQKTIRAYARAGAAAVLIEDKIWPRPLGQKGAKLVIERDEARLRCRAAVEACREAGILLLARTDARVSRGFDEALSRIKDFVAAGADILFLDSPQSEAEMRASVAACEGRPALAVTAPAGKHFMPGDAELARLGIRLVVYPQDILAATVHAVRGALAALTVRMVRRRTWHRFQILRPRSGWRTTSPSTNACRAEADDCARQTSRVHASGGCWQTEVPSVTHSDTRRAMPNKSQPAWLMPYISS